MKLEKRLVPLGHQHALQTFTNPVVFSTPPTVRGGGHYSDWCINLPRLAARQDVFETNLIYKHNQECQQLVRSDCQRSSEAAECECDYSITISITILSMSRLAMALVRPAANTLGLAESVHCHYSVGLLS